MKKLQNSENNASYKPHTATKRVGVMMLVSFFLLFSVGIVSAFEFDNIGRYDETTRTITIKNSVLGIPFLQLGTVAEIQLDSPDVVYVIRGKDRKVAEFTINNHGGYSNAFKKMEFYNIKKDMKKFEREFTYKYKKSLGFETINDYETVCEDKVSLNGTKHKNCYQELTGTHQEEIFEWAELDAFKELPMGEITIGIFIDVYAGDKVEWIPTLFGIRIGEWAVWTESLNVDLVSYYKLDDDAANTDVEDIYGANEGTIVGGETSADMSVEGKIVTALEFDGNDYITIDDDPSLTLSKNMSISLWIKPTLGAVNSFMNKGVFNTDGYLVQFSAAGVIDFYTTSSPGTYQDTRTTTTLTDGVWQHLVISCNNGVCSVYINNTECDYEQQPTHIDPVDGATALLIGARTGPTQETHGALDEIGIWNRTLSPAEIEELWNGGDGLPFLSSSAIHVALISPANTTVISSVGENFTVNYTAFVNLTNATYYVWDNEGAIFNQTTVTITGLSNSTTLYIDEFTLGNYEWNVKACTVSNCSFAENNFTLIAGATINNEQYNNYTYETSSETFEINITILPDSTLYNAQLFYDGTPYEGEINLISGEQYSITTTIDIPVINSSSELLNFFWQFIYPVEGGNFVYKNHSSSNQNVSEIQIGPCSGGLTNITLNFTNWDEENRTIMTPFGFHGTFLYWLGDGTAYENISFSNINVTNQTICILPANLTYYSDAQIQYEKSNYMKRNYYLVNATLTNVTQHIKLFSLLTTSSTSFIIEVIDESQIPVTNAYIHIQRYYTGAGIFETIEMAKTDITGSTVGHFEVETEDYKIVVFRDGEVLFESGAQKIFCRETPCTITFQIEAAIGAVWNDFGDIASLIWSMEFDENTALWTYTYIDTSGTVQYGRLHVYHKKADVGKITICNTTSSSASATLTCNVTGYDGEIYAASYISRSPELLVYLKSVIVSGLKKVLGLEGLFLSMFVLLLLGLIGLWNPAVGIISVVGGMIILNFMGLASFGAVTIWGVIFIAVIILWELKS